MKHLIDKRYTFKAEDDWGDYDNGKPRKGFFDKLGYCRHGYKCSNGEWNVILEHIAKWEFFNGKIPEGYEIDHKTPISNGGTNKLSNLRCVTHRENCNNETSYFNRSESHKGKTKTEEVKQKISKKLKGRKKIENSGSKPIGVCQYTLSGKLIKCYNSMLEAAIINNVDRSGISRCCNGLLKKSYGFIWKKADYYH